MPIAYMICGPTGAGKTTHARQLAEQKNAVRFSIDEWMASLFQPDAPAAISFEWALDRVLRCEQQIRQTAAAVLAAGKDVVLDLGFTTREQRDRFREWAKSLGASVTLHHVTADTAKRRARVTRRNEDHSEIFAFQVTDGMFDFMERMFEPPGEDERPVLTRTDRPLRGPD